MAKLLITLPNVGDVVHDLTAENVIVGRTSDNTIQIDLPSVALHHARFTRHARGWRLKDLGSTNQTWINGFAINEAELNTRCFIRFGSVDCIFLPEAKGPAWTDQAELRKQIDAAKADIDKIANERNELQSARQQIAAELSLAKKEIEVITGECERLRQQNQNVAALFDEQKKENAELAEQRNAAQKRAAGLAAANAEFTIKTDDLRAERDRLRENFDSITRELAGARTEIETLKTDLQNARTQTTQFAAEADQYRARVDSLVSQNTETSQELAEARSARDTLARALETERARLQKMQAEMIDLNAKNEALQQSIHHHEARIHAVEAQRDQLHNANKQLTENLNGLQHDIQSLTAHWNELLSKLQRLSEGESSAVKFSPLPARAISEKMPAEPSANISLPKHEPPAVSLSNGHSSKPAEIEKTNTQHAPAVMIFDSRQLAPETKSESAEDQLDAAFSAMRPALDRLQNNFNDRFALHELFGSARAVAQHADSNPALAAVRCMASTLEALLGDLCKVPEQLDPEKFLTVNRAVETLQQLSRRDHFTASRDSFRAKICVISDDVEEPMIAAMRLVDLDISTINYPTARFDAIAEQECELIVLDPGPREPGWLEYCLRIREFPRHKKTPIVVMTTSHEMSECRQSAAQQNCGDDFVTKPFNAFEMAVKILNGIFRRRLEHASALV